MTITQLHKGVNLSAKTSALHHVNWRASVQDPICSKNSETDIEGPEPGLLQDGPSLPQSTHSKINTYR